MSGSEPPAPVDFDRLAVYYDLEHHDITDDLQPLAEFARASSGPILELACGTGRVLPALAVASQTVVGLDYSKAMLKRAQRRVAMEAAPSVIRLLRSDMRSFRLSTRFGLIVVALNSFMHLTTRSEQEQVLQAIAGHLRPEGRVIIDLFNPESTLDESSEGALLLHCLHYLPEQSAFVLHFHSVRTDRIAQLVMVDSYYDETTADGTTKRHVAPYRLRYLHRAEVELLWQRAGLQIEAVYGDYDLGPAEDGSPRLLVVARRT
ncbi:MAG: methyltransferase type 12 [Dehalococcoidia bacterium]|nr:methyltransferase type 12 [Dehalococcoidia bacterium]